MIPFSNRTSWPSESNPLTRLAAQLREEKVPVLDLTLSNPTRCRFDYLKTDLLKNFLAPENLFYDPDAYGLLPAREAVCRYYAAKGIPVKPAQVLMTASTSEAYSFLFRLLFEPGDLLLAPQPSYPLLDFLASLNDVRVERYLLDPEQAWKLQPKSYYELGNAEPKAFLVVNPNNPTGNYLHEPELAEINLFCKPRRTAIISDEVFFDYPLTGANTAKPVSTAANNSQLTFTLSGISKILGLPQMKLSWIIVSGPENETAEAMKRLEIISDTYLSVSTPVQRALPQWLGMQETIQKEIRARLEQNHQFLKNKFSGARHPVHLFPAEGGWHAVLRPPSERTDEDWACLLLKNDRVLTHPGYLFDFQEGSYLVLSLLVPHEDFRAGIEKIPVRVRESLSV